MDLLIALVVIIVGFMVFASLFYGAAKLFLHKKGDINDLDVFPGHGSPKLKVNKTRNIYSFK